ncbi:MAG: rRNA maturation RNase YbeY [Deltaproteobacteria bacterium]|nr:MAG: rRNA maturation RNase YbeY [Deltaproteobacteria bacterium]
MAIHVRLEYRDPELSAAALRRTAKTILEAVGWPEAELSILVVDDAAMRTLNREYRGLDRTTDVLAFPQSSPELAGPGGEVLGDVVLSAPRARVQAKRYRRSFQGELERLLVHGVLHLLGHDHKRAGERARMRAEERRLLTVLRQAHRRG